MNEDVSATKLEISAEGGAPENRIDPEKSGPTVTKDGDNASSPSKPVSLPAFSGLFFSCIRYGISRGKLLYPCKDTDILFSYAWHDNFFN